MVVAVACALVSVALGTALGLLPQIRRPLMSAIQTFAMAAGIAVVVGHLLPESAEALGAWTFVAFFAGLVAPLVAEAALGRDHAHHHAHDGGGDVATEIGYLGLLVHQFGDGIGLSLTGLSERLGPDAALALSAHTVPITTLFVMRIAAHHGRSSAVRHALGLALATVGGIALGWAAPQALLQQVEPWVEAVVAGLLLHVIGHDLGPVEVRSSATRGLDLLALVAGIAIACAGSHAHAEHHGGSIAVRRGFLHALLDLGLEAAPVCLIGLGIAAAIRPIYDRRVMSRAGAGHPAPGAFTGFSAGVGKPLETAREMAAAGGRASEVAAVLWAAPATSLWVTLLTWRFLGLGFAVTRLVLALALARAAGAAVAAFAQQSPDARRVESAPVGARVDVFDQLLLAWAPWMVVGLIAAAYLDALIPAGQLAGLSSVGLDVPLFALVALPGLACAGSIVPAAAVLVGKGLSGGAVLVVLLLAPAISARGARFLGRTYGARAALVGHFVMMGLALPAGWLFNAAGPITTDLLMERAAHGHGVVAVCGVTVLAFFGMRSIWRHGLQGWVLALLDSPRERPSHSC